MKNVWTLTGVGNRTLRFTTRQSPHAVVKSVRPVLTVADVCRSLRKSRRQVYRYLNTGRLQPCGQVLGQWLFAPEEIKGLARQGVPRTLQRYFWDARCSTLSPVHHRDFIVARLLEFGDRAALRWLFQTYSRNDLSAFLTSGGAVRLSPRSRRFWAVFFGLSVPSSRQWSWRSRGRAWGGVP